MDSMPEDTDLVNRSDETQIYVASFPIPWHWRWCSQLRSGPRLVQERIYGIGLLEMRLGPLDPAPGDLLRFWFDSSVADALLYALDELADPLMSHPPRRRCSKPAPP